MKCTGKQSVTVQISIDTENKIMQSRELDGKYCHENGPTAVYFGCKNKLNKHMQEYGLCMFLRYHDSVLFENNILLINVDGYKLWLDPKKIC